MKITDIEYIDKGKNVNITTDEDYSFVITVDTSLEFPLEVGMYITEGKITDIMYHDMGYKAGIAALKLVSSRMRSEKEIRDYIRGKGYDERVQDEVVEKLTKDGYIDDAEFAKCFARDRVNLNKQGRERIAYELRLKGVSDENIARAILPLVRYELDNAVYLLKRRYKPSDLKNRKLKKKMSNFLQRKGYPNEVINKAFKVFGNE